MWSHFNTYNESAFENFGVRAFFIVQNNVPTNYETTYKAWDKSDPRLVSQEAADKVVKMNAGDGTVTFMSQIGPAFKWADEFENPSKDALTRPVKILHYCNNLGKRMNIYDNSDYKPNNEWINKLKDENNNYLGVQCKCGTPEF